MLFDLRRSFLQRKNLVYKQVKQQKGYVPFITAITLPQIGRGTYFLNMRKKIKPPLQKTIGNFPHQPEYGR